MPTFQPFDWYEEALYYDIIFDQGTDQEADFLVAAHARYARSGGLRALEPGCGTGRLVTALAWRGFQVTGFDLSEASLRFARERLAERGLRARLLEDRMESFRIRGRFDLAHCLVSTFKYLPCNEDARAHLVNVARVLQPGGIYVLGLHLTDYQDRRRNRERWVGRRGDVEVVCNIQGWPADRRRRTEQVRTRLTISRPGAAPRRLETTWQFRTYSVRQLRNLLRSVPALEHVATHDFAYDIDRQVPLDGQRIDVVLVLRRR